MEWVEVDRGLRAAQIAGGSKKDGGEMSPLEAVGHRYAMEAKIKQVSFVTAKHFSDLDVYLEHLPAKLTTTFLDLLDEKQAINFLVAVYVRYSHPNKNLTDREPIGLHSGKRLVTSPLVFDRELDSLIDTVRERHIMFNRNLRSGRG